MTVSKTPNSGTATWLLKLRLIKKQELCMKFKRKGKCHNLSVSCQLDLFDKVVKPIVLYGSGVWGFRNCLEY
jgi:hypothetical protein